MQEVKRPATATTSKASEPVKTNVIKERPLSSGASDKNCLLYTSTMTDVAYYYIDELQALGDIPPSLQNYIDYAAYGRDLDMGGCFIETSRGMCEIPY